MSLLSLFKWHRVVGIAALSLVAYILVVRVFGDMDVSWIFPHDKPGTTLRMHWPNLPFFTVTKDIAPDGKNQETYYTVPTRQLTAKELAQLDAGKKEAGPIAQPAPAPAGR
jgi:hypothetical protein